MHVRTWESGWIVLASFVLGCADGRAPALVDAAWMDETTGPDIAPDPGTPSDAGPEEARDS